MEDSRKFDPKKLAKLNDPERLRYLNPDLIWEKAALRNPEVLVDIGAGTGFFALIFSRKIKGKVYACDISEDMLRWMNDNLPPESKGVIVPTRMKESSIPLPDAAADLVYMINLHHELEEPVRVIEESLRLLKKGGKLIIVDWNKEETPEGPPIEIRVEEAAIEAQMRKSGFSLISRYNVLPYHNFLIGEKI